MPPSDRERWRRAAAAALGSGVADGARFGPNSAPRVTQGLSVLGEPTILVQTTSGFDVELLLGAGLDLGRTAYAGYPISWGTPWMPRGLRCARPHPTGWGDGTAACSPRAGCATSVPLPPAGDCTGTTSSDRPQVSRHTTSRSMGALPFDCGARCGTAPPSARCSSWSGRW